MRLLAIGAIMAAVVPQCPSLAAPSLAEARSYVVNIYRAIPQDDFNYRSVRYAGELARLIQHDESCAARSGGICVTESIPFCECQDEAEDYAVLSSTVTRRGKTTAAVTITVRNDGIQRFVIDLDRSSGMWRVADIHGSRTRSFTAFLRHNLPN